MTDKAFSDTPTSYGATTARPAKPSPSRPTDKVVSMPQRNLDYVNAAFGAEADLASALELIREATEAIRLSEERAQDLENQLDQFVERAGEEVRRLNADLLASEQRLLRSEEQCRLAEARADEAESWLARLHDAVHSAFSPLRRRGPGEPAPAPRSRDGSIADSK